MKGGVAFAIVVVLLSTVVPPALAVEAGAPAPGGDPVLLAALSAATEGAPVAAGGITIPSPEEARRRAEDAVLARATPERLAGILDALASGAPVDHLDMIAAGVVLHHAAPERAGTPLADRARAAVAEATALRLAAAPRLEDVPGLTKVAPPEVPDAPTLPDAPAPPAVPDAPEAPPAPEAPDFPVRFGDARLLGTVDRTLRVDDLRVETSSLLDYSATMTSVATSSANEEFRNEYSYYYANWWFTYSYYYLTMERTTESHSYYEQVTRALYEYRHSFDHWQMTSGVSVSLLEQSAPTADGATARVLYALASPYSYIDHWWVIYTFESLFYSIYHTESHYYARYWQEVTSQYSVSGSSSSSSTYSYTNSFRFTAATTREGHERVPVHGLELVGTPVITIDLPLGEYAPLLRQENVVDMTSAAAVELPGQVGVEYKDRKASGLIVTSPDVTDLSVALTTNPLSNLAIATAEGAVLTAGGLLGPAPVAEPPVDPITSVRDARDAALAAVAYARDGVLLPLLQDPQGTAERAVADVCADAAADPTGCVPELECAGDCVPVIECPGDCVAVPDAPTLPERPLWLRATYVADFLVSWRAGGAGLGFVTLDGAFPAGGQPIVVTVRGAGIGAPVGFLVDRDGADLVARPIGTPDLPPAPDAPEAPDLPVGLPAFSTEDPILAIPYEASFPAFLEEAGVASGDVTELELAKASLLSRMTPARLARTLAGLEGAATPEGALPYSDVLGASVLAYHAGPGYEEDPTFGEAARERVRDAILIMLEPEQRDHVCAAVPDAGVEPPTPPTAPGSPSLPPEVPSAPDAPDAPALCVPSEADALVASATAVPLDRLRALQFGGAVLHHETATNSGVEIRDHSALFERIATTAQSYVAYYESTVRYEHWLRYSQDLFRYTESASATGDATLVYDRVASYRQWFDRFDFLSGVTTVAVGLGNETLGDASATALYGVVFPFSFTNRWYVDELFTVYEDAHLSRYQAWSYYYRYQVLNGRATTEFTSSSMDRPLGSVYVTTRFTVDGAAETVELTGLNVAPGASVSFAVPATTYAVLARTPAPFLTGNLVPGSVPFQAATDEEGEFWAERLVLSPVPNAFRIRIDEDPTVAKPLERVGDAEAALVTGAGDARDAADALAHDPTGPARPGLATVGGIVAPILADPEAYAGETAADLAAAAERALGDLQATADGRLAALAAEAERLLADPAAYLAALLPGAPDPEAVLGAVPADPAAYLAGAAEDAQRDAAAAADAARGAVVDVPVVSVPKTVDEDVYYDVEYAATGFSSLRLAIAHVGVLVAKDALDARPVLVTVTGQAVAGAGALGASGPFRLVHALDVSGADLLPDSVGGPVAPASFIPPVPSDLPEVA